MDNREQIKTLINKIKLHENKNSLMLNNNIELILYTSVNDKQAVLSLFNPLSDVLMGRVSDILLNVNSDWFTISFRTNLDGQYVEFLLSSQDGIKMFMDSGEVVYVNSDFINLLSGISRIFNQNFINRVKQIL